MENNSLDSVDSQIVAEPKIPAFEDGVDARPKDVPKKK